MSKTIIIQPGGYHPFHAGHYALYQSAKKMFSNADMYVAATADTKSRPFPFEIKEKLAKLAGVKPGEFVQVKSPFQAKEITSQYDPETDVVIFIRSEKDRSVQPIPGGTKKDGTPAYFQPYTGKNLKPFGKHGYIAYLPTVEFGPGITSASEIRNAWPNLNDKQKLTLVMSLYPAAQKNKKLATVVVNMLDEVMGSPTSEKMDENKTAKGPESDDLSRDSIGGTADEQETLTLIRKLYPEAPNTRSAFIKFVINGLETSKKDADRQEREISELKRTVAELQQLMAKTSQDNN